MTEQQRADALLRQHQLQRILKELELDIAQVVTAQVVTAQYSPHPQHFGPSRWYTGLSTDELAQLNDQPNVEAMKVFDQMQEYFA